MEVEFLSNLRYNLFAGDDEWARWQSRLGFFGDYLSKASIAPIANGMTSNSMLQISPNSGPTQRMQSLSPLPKLPSPPNDSARWPPLSSVPPNGLPQVAQPRIISDVQPVQPRKRSRDDLEVDEYPMKRMAMPNMVNLPVSVLPPASALTSYPTRPPALTPTSAPLNQPISGAGTRLPPPNLQIPNTLPSNIPTPVSQTPSNRAMPPVYNPPTTWAPPSAPTSMPAVSNAPYNTQMSLPNPTLGYQSQGPFDVRSAAVSPALSSYAVHTPQTHLSPSFFLSNRYSPYRPVRAVNTLLIPPPSGSVQQQRSVPYDHMHYQPLGKPPAERRTGLLPYARPENWSGQPVYHPQQYPT